MGGTNSKIINDETNELYVLKRKIDKEGLVAANTFLKESINRWKTERVKLAVSGTTGTGKSTFINTLRDVKRGDEGYAEVGFGDTTLIPTPYNHPYNPRIVYYDLPGVGTAEVRKENYISCMNIYEYDFVFIFFDKVITEDILWLVGEIEKLGKQYCLVRSKLDEDMSNAERENMDRECVTPLIRKKIKTSMEKNDKLKNVPVFFISCADTSVGDLSEMLSYVESNLDEIKRESMVSSMKVVSENVINLKYKVLKARIEKIAFAAAGITAFPIPGADISIDIALLIEEVIHYINCFGLGEKKLKLLTGFNVLKLKCSKILLPDAEMAAFLVARSDFYATIELRKSVLELFMPLFGSTISSATSSEFTHKFLNGILKDLRDDALIVYRHIGTHQIR